MPDVSEPRILIVKTGSTFPATRRRFGDYDRWFVEALRATRVRCAVHDITRAPPPRLQPYQGLIVTGSPAGVYQDLPWMQDLVRLLRMVAEAQKPETLAVCFGAQALAHSLGGRVTPSPLGWEIGTVRVRRTRSASGDALLHGRGGEDAFQATHRDWIEALPVGATVLAENDMSPFQAFRIGESVWGTQFHPEATPAILEDLLRARRHLLGERRCYRSLVSGLAPTPAGKILLERFARRAAG